MEYKNEFYQAESFESASYTNEFDLKKHLENVKQIDKGYNKIWRKTTRDGITKRTKIELYTTSSMGNHIRDAETGEYYPYLRGSFDEYLFFSVALATGECRSSNESNALFYISPESFMQHQNTRVDEDIILKWRERRANRVREREKESKKPQSISSYVSVN
jgi:hypothetical protein